MILEVGKKYKVRCGHECLITMDTNKEGYQYSHQPMRGVITGKLGFSMIAFFTVDGRYNPQIGESKYDLTKEIVK